MRKLFNVTAVLSIFVTVLIAPLNSVAQDQSSSGIAGSTFIVRPNNATPSYPLGEMARQGADSSATAEISNYTPITATVSRPGSGCPQGWVWGAPYGVSNCLRPIDKCEAAYLTWISGNAICQGFAPATAAFFYVPKRYYRGQLVEVCPPGVPKAECAENYVREDSPSISVMTSGLISPSVGAAAAICRSGTWAIVSSNCRLPTAQ